MKTNNTLYRSSWRIWITKRLLTVTPMNCTGGNRWRRHDSCLPASRSRPSRWMRAKKWPERDNATCKNNTPIKRWIKGVFVDSLLSPVFLLTDGITLTGGLCVRNYITRWICLIPPPADAYWRARRPITRLLRGGPVGPAAWFLPSCLRFHHAFEMLMPWRDLKDSNKQLSMKSYLMLGAWNKVCG